MRAMTTDADAGPQDARLILEAISPALKDPAATLEAIRLERTLADAQATNRVRAQRAAVKKD
jgi:hypothetical protein